MPNLVATLAETTVSGVAVDGAPMVENIKTLLSGVFTMDNLIAIIGGALALAGGFVIFHFGYRFIKGKVSKAMKRGSL